MNSYSTYSTETLRKRELLRRDYREIQAILTADPHLLSRFTDDPEIIESDDVTVESERLLARACLVRYQRARLIPAFRIHSLHNLLITTDFPIPLKDRVFPWSDEAELVIEWLQRLYQPLSSPTRILNVCSGSGTIALWLAKEYPAAHVEGLDIEERAVAVSQFNAALNFANADLLDENRNVSFNQSELFARCRKNNTRYDLIVADPPFALQPPHWSEIRHSQGGVYGDKVVVELLSQVRNYLRPGGRFMCLAYGLGSEEKPEELLKHVRHWLCEPDEDPERKVHLLTGTMIWRFMERKRIQSPMPLRYLAMRCGDPTYQQYERAKNSVEEYIDWIEGTLLKKTGSTHLHYVLIDHTEAA